MPPDYNQYWDYVEEYALELMVQRHGYPLCDPDMPEFSRAPAGLEEYRSAIGPQVGDVGQLASGSFMCFFNIFLPKDHPLNSKCPPSFVPCTSSSSTTVTKHYLPPQTEINTMRSIPSPLRPVSNDGTVAMHDVGALLKLPNGVRRVDLVDIEHVRDYIIQNAPLWIKDEYTSLEDLYLITGTDLTNMWNIQLEFPPRQSFELLRNSKGRVYYEESVRIDSSRRWNSTDRAKSSVEFHNQCVFLRGFRIGYRYSGQSLLHRLLRCTNQLVPGKPVILSKRPQVKPRPKTFKRFLYEFRESVSKLGVTYDATIPPEFHPLNVVNQMLLLQNPLALVAVTHDDDWSYAMNEDDAVTPSLLTLLTRIRHNYEQVRSKDAVYLRPRPHHRLHIITSQALAMSRAPKAESDSEAETITGDISPYLLASIALSGSIDSRLKNVAQAALNLMQATLRIEVCTRGWTLLASRFISAVALLTRLLADENRTKDKIWDKAFAGLESLLDRSVTSIQNQDDYIPSSRLVSSAAIVYFNTRLRGVLAPLKVSTSKTSVSNIKTQADINRVIDRVAQNLQS